MSVGSYLDNLAKDLIIRDDEKASIKKSFDTLKWRLESYFGSDIGFVKKFGSYHRETILPRKHDFNSDVDVMILFKNKSYQPQTYLNKLKLFAEYWYSRSEIYQSNPTIVLELNHIKFELVPCIEAEYYESGNYKIPSKASDYSKWLLTSPFEFNDSLTTKNIAHNYKIKPLVRVMKKWNTKQRVYSSFELEKKIVNCYSFSWNNSNLKEYLYDFVGSLSYFDLPYQYQKDRVKNLIDKISEIKRDEYQYPTLSEIAIKEIFE